MTARLLSLALLPALLCAGELRLENSNFLLTKGGEQPDFYDYNRLRLYAGYQEGNWFAQLTADWRNHYGQEFVNSPLYEAQYESNGDVPFDTKSGAYKEGPERAYLQLHRLYGGYAVERHSLTVGLQQVSWGVGRLWSPTDLFNPENPFALEPDEVYGIYGVSYAYAFGDLARAEAVAAQRRNQTFKYAGRVKGYTRIGDVGASVVKSEKALMLGYELEGDLFDTGALWRSEGGYFKEEELNAEFFQGILGADYGFEEGTNVALEWLYTSKTFDEETVLERRSELPDTLMSSHHFLGATVSRQFGLLWFGSLAYIENIDGKHRYFAPNVEYSLSDEMTLSGGAMVFDGQGVGAEDNSYYVRWFVAF